jgi:hypothetical protein
VAAFVTEAKQAWQIYPEGRNGGEAAFGRSADAENGNGNYIMYTQGFPRPEFPLTAGFRQYFIYITNEVKALTCRKEKHIFFPVDGVLCVPLPTIKKEDTL